MHANTTRFFCLFIFRFKAQSRVTLVTLLGLLGLFRVIRVIRVIHASFLHYSKMSYFKKSADYYINLIQRTPNSVATLIERCKAKAPRGINVVEVTPKMLGKTFTPACTVDPGRIFLTYERLVENVPGLDQKNLAVIKTAIETYKPESELLFLVMEVQTAEAELLIYTVCLPAVEMEVEIDSDS